MCSLIQAFNSIISLIFSAWLPSLDVICHLFLYTALIHACILIQNIYIIYIYRNTVLSDYKCYLKREIGRREACLQTVWNSYIKIYWCMFTTLFHHSCEVSDYAIINITVSWFILSERNEANWSLQLYSFFFFFFLTWIPQISFDNLHFSVPIKMFCVRTVQMSK